MNCTNGPELVAYTNAIRWAEDGKWTWIGCNGKTADKGASHGQIENWNLRFARASGTVASSLGAMLNEENEIEVFEETFFFSRKWSSLWKHRKCMQPNIRMTTELCALLGVARTQQLSPCVCVSAAMVCWLCSFHVGVRNGATHIEFIDRTDERNENRFSTHWVCLLRWTSPIQQQSQIRDSSVPNVVGSAFELSSSDILHEYRDIANRHSRCNFYRFGFE